MNVGFSNANPGPGEEVEVTATVLNNGTAPAENVVVQFVDATGGNVPIGASQVISSIPDGGSGVATIAFTPLQRRRSQDAGHCRPEQPDPRDATRTTTAPWAR